MNYNLLFWRLRRGTPISLSKIKRDQEVGILYLNENERKNYELTIKKGVFSYQNENMPLNNTHYLLFGLDKNGQFYGKLGFEWKNYGRGYFGHGSFLSGGYLMAAGELYLMNGKLRYISSNSGHYLPTNRHMCIALYNLYRNGVDLSNVILVLYKHKRSSPVSRGRYIHADFYNALQFLEKGEEDCPKLNSQLESFKKDIQYIREYTNKVIDQPNSSEQFKPHRLSN